jgi:DNA-directed RNA polymerase specialized sigma24 family protein
VAADPDAAVQNVHDAALLSELRRTNHLLAVLATRGLEQREAIAFLDSIGLRPVEIANAVGITRNAVNITLHRLRKTSAGADRTGVTNSDELAGGTDE